MSPLIDSWNLSRLVDMNYDLRYLYNSEISAPLCYQLRPFISSYRDHSNVSKKDMDQDDRKSQESVLSQENLYDTLRAIRSGRNVTYLGYRRQYLEQYKGYRSYYALGYNE